MANYECATRTNYFRVKDPEAFRKFMSRVYGGCELEVWEEKDTAGNIQFGFGCYDGISGYEPESPETADDNCDYGYDEFLEALQQHIAEDDAVIILECGHEKLRYIIASAIIVTSKDIESLDVCDIAASRAAVLLNNPSWCTKCDY